MARGVDLTWAGGEHTFLLTVDLLRAVQDKCDAGPAYILERLSTRRWHVDDVLAPIRLGLEGGGMDKEDARKMVKRHVEDEPLAASVLTAQAVLMSVLYGAADEDDGDGDSGEAPAAADA